jgi:hypothetical protein
MPVIAIAVGAIGSAIGTAIGTAIGGTILGVSAATIGGVIGAGLAGGLMATMTGGSFGKGFLMGAVGAGVGAFLKGGLGSSVFGDATIAPDGTTLGDMYSLQGGAEFMPDALSNAAAGDLGTGAIASGAETFGIGDVSSVSGTPLEGAETFGLTDTGLGDGMTLNPPAQDIMAPMGMGGTEQNLTDSLMQGEANFMDSKFGEAGMTYDYPFSQPNASSPFMSDTSSYLESMGTTKAPFEGSVDMSYPGAQTAPNTTLENIGTSSAAAVPAPTIPATTNQPLQTNATTQTYGQKAMGYVNKADDWLQKNLGAPKGSAGRVLSSTPQFLMDMYDQHKLSQQAKGLAPMSLEQWRQQNMDEEAWRHAAGRMAQSGRTGSLPVLLARMRSQAGRGYDKYRQDATMNYLGAKTYLADRRTASLKNLFTPFSQAKAVQDGGY